MTVSPYEYCVFVNCPFDDDYADLFDAVIFTVHDCGFVARSALEVDNSAQVRINKIFDIIKECKYGIHDISRTELNVDSGLPRFNMPLELGIFLGAKRFGTGKQRQKSALVMDRERFRYQVFCSDIAGQDIKAHQNKTEKAIKVVRDWLRSSDETVKIPSGSKIARHYSEFREDLPDLCSAANLDLNELIYNDYTTLVVQWLKAHPWE